MTAKQQQKLILYIKYISEKLRIRLGTRQLALLGFTRKSSTFIISCLGTKQLWRNRRKFTRTCLTCLLHKYCSSVPYAYLYLTYCSPSSLTVFIYVDTIVKRNASGILIIPWLDQRPSDCRSRVTIERLTRDHHMIPDIALVVFNKDIRRVRANGGTREIDQVRHSLAIFVLRETLVHAFVQITPLGEKQSAVFSWHFHVVVRVQIQTFTVEFPFISATGTVWSVRTITVTNTLEWTGLMT